MSKKPKKPPIARRKVLARLHRAHERQHFVEVQRWFPRSDPISGFVSAVGRKWVAVAILSDGKEPDGWDLVRLKDISRVRIDPDPDAIAIRVLRARGQWPIAAPSVDLDDTDELVRDAGAAAALQSIHVERHRPDALWVGALIGIAGKVVQLDGLTPDAEWQEEVLTFRIRDITRVTLGNEYAEALALVAGTRPTRSGARSGRMTARR